MWPLRATACVAIPRIHSLSIWISFLWRYLPSSGGHSCNSISDLLPAGSPLGLACSHCHFSQPFASILPHYFLQILLSLKWPFLLLSLVIYKTPLPVEDLIFALHQQPCPPDTILLSNILLSRGSISQLLESFPNFQCICLPLKLWVNDKYHPRIAIKHANIPLGRERALVHALWKPWCLMKLKQSLAPELCIQEWGRREWPPEAGPLEHCAELCLPPFAFLSSLLDHLHYLLLFFQLDIVGGTSRIKLQLKK